MSDHGEMCNAVRDYFKNLFFHDSMLQRDQMRTGGVVVSDAQNKKFVEDFSFEEFTTAVKQMHPEKSTGPDGLNLAFYQNFWHLVGREVFACCKTWMCDLTYPANLNDIMVDLIPKKDEADSMKDLRLITLCNVLYKVIAKVLSNRLREILPGIITENQSALFRKEILRITFWWLLRCFTIGYRKNEVRKAKLL